MKNLKDKEILKYIEDVLLRNSVARDDVIFKYHHNSSYENAPSILKNGILSQEKLSKLQGRTLTEEEKRQYDSETGHVNDVDGISLSIVGLKDLYKDEEEYEPRRLNVVDFLISGDVKAHRMTDHYGNEFIANDFISNKDICSVDIRYLKILRDILRENRDIDKRTLLSIINSFNMIRKIAITKRETGLEIPLRDMSLEPLVINEDNLLSSKEIVLKR